MSQTTSNILMISPLAFRYNKQTASNNYYQKFSDGITPQFIQENAKKEFDDLVYLLKQNSINVITIADTPKSDTPDSIFPNNWISFHKNGIVCLYPMFAKNRRDERRIDILDLLKEKYNFLIKKINDFSKLENKNLILEGTGSMVLDRENKIAYAALSERTNKLVLKKFCNKLGYNAVCFNAYQTIDNKRLPIYHTNVIMNIGKKIATVCLNSIDNETEKIKLTNTLNLSKKIILDISESQCNKFAGNMLEVKNTDGIDFTIMSTAAYKSLSIKQIKLIKTHTHILYSPLYTIEACGGGSARCMMAEIFLPKK